MDNFGRISVLKDVTKVLEEVIGDVTLSFGERTAVTSILPANSSIVQLIHQSTLQSKILSKSEATEKRLSKPLS